MPMNKTTSMDIFAGFVKERVEAFGESVSADGFQVGVNLRQRVGELEWAISPAYTEIDFDGESESAFQVSLSGEYFIAPTVSLGAALTVGEDANGFTVGVRYHF